MKIMKHFVVAVVLLLSHTVVAAPPVVPAPPLVLARGYILIDHNSGYVIAESNADTRMEPASLTKMMTSYVISHELAKGRLTLNEKVRISEKAWRMAGSRMFAQVGTELTVEELLKGVIVQSGNDATVALAEHAAGSEDAFVSLMNSHAQRLGMKGTHYVNSTGMPDPNHYTTARDLGILGRALIAEFPEHYAWYSIKEMTHNGITQPNRNRLLWRGTDYDGIKTGHTETAGYCLVASGQHEGMRLISVVLGTKSEDARADESQKLLTFGFRFYDTRKLYAGGENLTTARVWKGDASQLPLGLQQDLYVTFPRGQYDQLKANLEVAKQITAPVGKGDTLGKVNVLLGDKTVAVRDLQSLQAVEAGGIVQTLVDEVKLLFE